MKMPVSLPATCIMLCMEFARCFFVYEMRYTAEGSYPGYSRFFLLKRTPADRTVVIGKSPIVNSGGARLAEEHKAEKKKKK